MDTPVKVEKPVLRTQRSFKRNGDSTPRTPKGISAARSAFKALQFLGFAKGAQLDSSFNSDSSFSSRKDNFRPPLLDKERLESPIDFNNPDDQRLLTSILVVRPEKRYEEEILLLEKAFRDINIFKSIRSQMDENNFRKVFRALRVDIQKPGHLLFNYGDFGKTFYVIIKGSVYVMVKSHNTNANNNSKANTNTTAGKKAAKKAVVEAEKEKEREALLEDLEDFLRDEENTEEQKVHMVEKCHPGFWVARTMERGEAFGEIALAQGSDRRRTATIICREDCVFGVLSFGDYSNLLADLIEKKTVDNVAYLSHLDIFTPWKHFELFPIVKSMEEVKYNRNHVIFREGDNPDKVYFIKSGEVELQKAAADEKDKEDSFDAQQFMRKNKGFGAPKGSLWAGNNKLKLAIVKEGNCFGEAELLNQNPREYTAVVKSVEVVLLSMDKEKFMNAFKEKKCVSNLEKYLNKKKTWRQDFLTKQADFRDILDQNRTANTPSPKNGLHSQKSQEYLLQDNQVGTPTNFSAFRKTNNFTPIEEPNVIRSPQFSRFKTIKLVHEKQKSESPLNKDKAIRFGNRRLTEEAVIGPESKIFSEKFLKRISQSKLAERSEKFRRDHANKLNKAIVNKNKQADEILPRKPATSNKSLTSDNPDPYYNFAGPQKPSHQDYVENPFESYGIVDNSRPITKTKAESPALKIKLMKSLGLDKVYQETASQLPQIERVESNSYLPPYLALNLTTDRYKLKNNLLDDSGYERTPKTHKTAYEKTGYESPMSATMPKSGTSGGKSPRFHGLTILQKKLSTITTANIK